MARQNMNKVYAICNECHEWQGMDKTLYTEQSS